MICCALCRLLFKVMFREWINKNTKVETYLTRETKIIQHSLLLVIWIACCSLFSHWNANGISRCTRCLCSELNWNSGIWFSWFIWRRAINNSMKGECDILMERLAIVVLWAFCVQLKVRKFNCKQRAIGIDDDDTKAIWRQPREINHSKSDSKLERVSMQSSRSQFVVCNCFSCTCEIASCMQIRLSFEINIAVGKQYVSQVCECVDRNRHWQQRQRLFSHNRMNRTEYIYKQQAVAAQRQNRNLFMNMTYHFWAWTRSIRKNTSRANRRRSVHKTSNIENGRCRDWFEIKLRNNFEMISFHLLFRLHLDFVAINRARLINSFNWPKRRAIRFHAPRKNKPKPTQYDLVSHSMCVCVTGCCSLETPATFMRINDLNQKVDDDVNQTEKKKPIEINSNSNWMRCQRRRHTRSPIETKKKKISNKHMGDRQRRQRSVVAATQHIEWSVLCERRPSERRWADSICRMRGMSNEQM